MARAGIYEAAPLPPAVFPGQGDHVASQRPRLCSPQRAQVRRPGLAPGGKERRREGGAEAGERGGAGAVYTRGGGATLPTGEAAWPGGRRRSLGRLFGSRLEEGAVAPRPRNLGAAPGLRETPPLCSWGFPSPGCFPWSWDTGTSHQTRVSPTSARYADATSPNQWSWAASGLSGPRPRCLRPP